MYLFFLRSWIVFLVCFLYSEVGFDIGMGFLFFGFSSGVFWFLDYKVSSRYCNLGVVIIYCFDIIEERFKWYSCFFCGFRELFLLKINFMFFLNFSYRFFFINKLIM